MTLFELIVIAGIAELLALTWIVTALAWPRVSGRRELGVRSAAGGARARTVSAGKPATSRPLTGRRFAPPGREGESAPGG